MPVRLSFSTFDLIHSCERKYQLEKLLAGSSREESEHLVFGTAYGVAVASYLANQDEDLAIWEMFLAYEPMIESDKKSLWRCIQAFIRSVPSLNNILEDYELVYFEDKPATELSFRLNIDSEFYYVGYIDAVLRHRYNHKYVVFEVKTTGMLLLDLSPLYKHSGQALGYSIVLDKIVGQELSSYGVLYFVCQLGKEFQDCNVHILPFDKTLLDRLNWFIVLGLDVQHLHAMKSLQIYPRRYTACLRFNKPCRHFGTCHLHSLDSPKQEEPDDIAYQFVYDLNEVVEDHLRRISQLPQELQECRAETGGEIIDLDSDDWFDTALDQVASAPALPSPAPAATAATAVSAKDKIAALLAAKRNKSS